MTQITKLIGSKNKFEMIKDRKLIIDLDRMFVVGQVFILKKAAFG